jgi:hypothetical protein
MFDEYLKRRSEVSRRYRELEDDGVPPELDRRVLDSAREAVEKPRRWMRWGAPIALAASTVLVVSIVIETGVDKHAVQTSMPAAPESQAAAAKIEEPPAADVPLAELEADAVQTQSYVPPAEVREESRVRRAPVIPGESNPPVMVVPVQPAAPAPQSARAPEAAAAAVAASPPPAASSDVNVSGSARGSSSEYLQRSNEIARDASVVEEAVVSAQSAEEAKRETQDKARVESRDRASGLSSGSAAARQLAVPNPDVWLETIRQLRRDGKILQADREWLRFRQVFPDYPVADDDVARVPGPR